MTTTERDLLKSRAYMAGQLLGEGAGDFYDVVAELAAGYASGVGVVNESEHHYKTVIAALNELQSVAGHVLEGIISDARDHSVSWSVIGDGLDVSKQAAQQKYGGKG